MAVLQPVEPHFLLGYTNLAFQLFLIQSRISKYLAKPFSKGVFHLDMQMTYSVFFTVGSQESYRLWFCKISNIIWKTCRTQTGWEGQQRVHRTMSLLTRAVRDIAEYLGKNTVWGTSGSLNLPGSYHGTSATPQNPDWKLGQDATPQFQSG